MNSAEMVKKEANSNEPDIPIFASNVEIRKGAFGREYIITDCRSNSKKFLVKVFDSIQISRREMSILEKLHNCPNIIKVVGTITGAAVPKYCFVFKFLCSLKSAKKSMEKTEVPAYLKQVFMALDACHSQKIIHRCVNDDTLLIDEERKVLKLTGFENAIEHKDDAFYVTDLNFIQYRSPELLLGVHKYDYAVDIWAAGCTIAGLLFNKAHIFEGGSNHEQLLEIVKILGWRGLLDYVEENEIRMDEYMKRKIQKYSGTGVQSLQTEDCTAEAINLVEELLICSPTKRLTAKEAQTRQYFPDVNVESLVFNENVSEKLNTQLKRRLSISRDNFAAKVEHVVGEGAGGTVYSVKELENSREFAVKCYHKDCSHRMLHEIEVLRRLKGCPNIVHLLGSFIGNALDIHFLLFDYISTTEWDYIYEILTSRDIQDYMYQLLSALESCHSRGIMHRDVKPSNLLIDHPRRMLYLTDWGHAEFYEEGKSYPTEVGSFHFCSPELLLKFQKYDYSVDIWSVGCILAGAIFRERYIFNGDSYSHLLRDIIKHLGSASFFDYCEKYDVQSSFTNRLMFKDHRRQNWSNFINSVNREVAAAEAIDLVDKLLVFDHRKRLTANQALNHKYFRVSFRNS